jgi:hypothetical protein
MCTVPIDTKCFLGCSFNKTVGTTCKKCLIPGEACIYTELYAIYDSFWQTDELVVSSTLSHDQQCSGHKVNNLHMEMAPFQLESLLSWFVHNHANCCWRKKLFRATAYGTEV